MFAVEPIDSIWSEFSSMCQAHWKETGCAKFKRPFNLCKERYLDYEKIGAYFQFTARNIGGKLVGIAGVYLSPCMQSQAMIASEDIVYLAPEARRGRNALDLHKFIERFIFSRGAQEMIVSAEPQTRVGKILGYLGYRVITHTYCKKLGYPNGGIDPQ